MGSSPLHSWKWRRRELNPRDIPGSFSEALWDERNRNLWTIGIAIVSFNISLVAVAAGRS